MISEKLQKRFSLNFHHVQGTLDNPSLEIQFTLLRSIMSLKVFRDIICSRKIKGIGFSISTHETK